MGRFVVRGPDGLPIGFFSERADASAALKEHIKFGIITEE